LLIDDELITEILWFLHYHYVVKEKIEDKKDRIKRFCFKDEEEI